MWQATNYSTKEAFGPIIKMFQRPGLSLSKPFSILITQWQPLRKESQECPKTVQVPGKSKILYQRVVTKNFSLKGGIAKTFCNICKKRT